MTMYASMDILPYEHICYVWDLFFVDGWKVLFRVALALLRYRSFCWPYSVWMSLFLSPSPSLSSCVLCWACFGDRNFRRFRPDVVDSLVAEELLQADFPVIVKFLNTFPKHRVPSVSKLLRTAQSFKVTNRQLFDMERHYSSVVNPEPDDHGATSSTVSPTMEAEFSVLSDDEGSGGGSGGGASGTTPNKSSKQSKGLRSVFNRFVRK